MYTLKMSKLNNRNYFGIDINQEYVDLSNRRVEGIIPFTYDSPNPKTAFIVSKQDALAKRKKSEKKNTEEIVKDTSEL